MSTRFLHVTYIRTTPAKLWDALIKPEFTQLYWFGMRLESEWKAGSSWKMISQDGLVTDAGEVLEIEPPRLLVLKWRNEFMPELKAEGFTRCTFEITPRGEATELRITHETDRDHSKTIEAVSGGWPRILASLKSLLETGQSLPVASAKA
jgi:uncharacterized protein YndB with AHSA1/START domain